MVDKIPEKPETLRVVVFIDGQNFYNDCKRVFGHGETHPHLLAQELCSSAVGGPNRTLQEVRFYTGIHGPRRDPKMNSYMQRRLSAMQKNGVTTISRPLKYSEEVVEDRHKRGQYKKIWKGREKGIDVRLALDMVIYAMINKYDIASLVSRDSDLEEAINDVFLIRKAFERWITVENVLCCETTISGKSKPLPGLDPPMRTIHFDQDFFDKIRDDTDYWNPPSISPSK